MYYPYKYWLLIITGQDHYGYAERINAHYCMSTLSPPKNVRVI